MPHGAVSAPRTRIPAKSPQPARAGASRPTPARAAAQHAARSLPLHAWVPLTGVNGIEFCCEGTGAPLVLLAGLG
jgi:hypothetical protein